MHASAILRRILCVRLPEIHAKRLTSLLAAVDAVVSGSRLTLSDLGRGLPGPVAVKHNIKRIDRLLGNGSLHTEARKLYETLARDSLVGISLPLIVIEVVLVFGGVLAFGWWQLRDLARERKKREDAKRDRSST